MKGRVVVGEAAVLYGKVLCAKYEVFAYESPTACLLKGVFCRKLANTPPPSNTHTHTRSTAESHCVVGYHGDRGITISAGLE